MDNNLINKRNICKICDEDEFQKVIGIEIKVKYENPKAYGYPEIVYWDRKYTTNYCPICGRRLENIKGEKYDE